MPRCQQYLLKFGAWENQSSGSNNGKRMTLVLEHQFVSFQLSSSTLSFFYFSSCRYLRCNQTLFQICISKNCPSNQKWKPPTLVKAFTTGARWPQFRSPSMYTVWNLHSPKISKNTDITSWLWHGFGNSFNNRWFTEDPEVCSLCKFWAPHHHLQASRHRHL